MEEVRCGIFSDGQSTRSLGELYSETAVPSGEDRQCQGRDRVRQRALTVIWFLGVGVPRQNLVHSQNECLGDGLDARVSIKILAMLWAIITSRSGRPIEWGGVSLGEPDDLESTPQGTLVARVSLSTTTSTADASSR